MAFDSVKISAKTSVEADVSEKKFTTDKTFRKNAVVSFPIPQF